MQLYFVGGEEVNARFAEVCRSDHMELSLPEQLVEREGIYEGLDAAQRAKDCLQDIHIGVFFDGTNNNKYRDTPGFGQTNVARLYEAYASTAADQTPPTFLPRVNDDLSSTPRVAYPDRPQEAGVLKSPGYNYRRKIYVPGVGTPMPDVGDSGEGKTRDRGLAAAYLTEVRLTWASMQLMNQVHAALLKKPLEPFIKLDAMPRSRFVNNGGAYRQSLFADLKNGGDGTAKPLGPRILNGPLNAFEQRLAAAIAPRLKMQPSIRKIRLSVFGFSRGAAAARAWSNIVVKLWPERLAGIPLQIDFLGLFDTVASVGLTAATPALPLSGGFYDGHDGPAKADALPIPGQVKRCVHLVAGHEIRASFPLDSVSPGGSLPKNCKEIVYPGVHSDVGGGYAPKEQGRAMGDGQLGDSLKLSQIPLAQMYREARMAGVPLVPQGNMVAATRDMFDISSELREAFNAYVRATRDSLPVVPTNGKGVAAEFARLNPSETQRRERLVTIMGRHNVHMLRWRRSLRVGSGNIAELSGLTGPSGLMRSNVTTRFQDCEDIRGADRELLKELTFLTDSDPHKFERPLDDPIRAVATGSGKDLVDRLVVSGIAFLPVLGKAFEHVVDDVFRKSFLC